MHPVRHDVVIAGGGPTGLMLAGELALAGVDVAIVERRVNQDVAGSRASGLHPRSIEVLDQRGIAERFIAQGTRHHVVPFAGTVLEGQDRPTRHNYTLALWQAKIERSLADWVAELGVASLRGREVTHFVQDDAGVHVELNDARVLQAKYLVGCDGGRSGVRKTAGIDFPGWDADVSHLIFEADLAEEPAWGVRHITRGVCALGKLDDAGRVRGVVTEQRLERGGEPAVDALRAALTAAYGSDFGVHNVTWLSRFTDAARQASTYRQRRVLLAGDAAHVRYDLGEGHPLLGRRMPDLDLLTAAGPVRLFSLLHDARPVLLTLGAPSRLDIAGWADRVKQIDASFDGRCEVPVVGPVQLPCAVLIRPDGHVAWVGEGTGDAGLERALRTWFGEPRSG